MPARFTRREIIAYVVLAGGLGIMAYHLAASLSMGNPHNDLAFRQAVESWDQYLDLRQEWRPRIGAAASAKLANVISASSDTEKQLRNAVGLHSALWMLATMGVLVAGFGRRALPLMWGVAAAVAFGYTPGLVSRVYPWDLPALFFFTAFTVVLARERWNWLPAVILVGALFKETTAVLCIAPLFLSGPWRRRIIWTGSLMAAFLVVKVGVDLLVQNPVPLLSPTVHPPEGDTWRLAENVKLLWRPPYTHPIWINAGTLVAVFAIPWRQPNGHLIRTIAVCFAGSIMIFGVASEYRIWFEMIPLCVLALTRWLLPPDDVARELQG